MKNIDRNDINPSSLQIIPVKRDSYIIQFEYSNDKNMEYFKKQHDQKIKLTT